MSRHTLQFETELRLTWPVNSTHPWHPKHQHTDRTDSSMEDNMGDECSGDNKPSDTETLRSQDSFLDID